MCKVNLIDYQLVIIFTLHLKKNKNIKIKKIYLKMTRCKVF